MNVLLFGRGAHIFSLIRKLGNSCCLENLYVAGELDVNCPNNNLVKYIYFDSLCDYKNFVKEKDIDLVVIPSTPSLSSFVNIFKYNFGVPTIGVTRYWAQLESSKLFAKEFMQKYDLPYSEYSVIKSVKDMESCIDKYGLPLVIKDNTLQAGFGVSICKTKKECINQVKRLLKKDKLCIAEKYLIGKEVTLHTIWDGETLVPLEAVKDYKRLENGDKGINTGSMGSYVPVFLTEKEKEMMSEYVQKLEEAFKIAKPNFTGIFVSDLFFTEDKVYNLEFNMRPGTPEFEVLVEHLDCDLLELLYKTAVSELKDVKIKYKSGYTGAVIVVHKDYKKQKLSARRSKIKVPAEFLTDSGNIKINTRIEKINEKMDAQIVPQRKIFTLLKNDIVNPFPNIYKHIGELKDKNLYYRTDIGDDIRT